MFRSTERARAGLDRWGKSHITAEREVIEPILLRYAGIFHDDENNDFKNTNVIVHNIETGDAAPIKKVPYKTPFALREEMNRQVQKMLDKGVISQSNFPWSSLVVLVPKKSGTGIPKYRFCVDFRALNAIIKNDSYPPTPLQIGHGFNL